MYITAQGYRLRNDLYCVEWDVKPYYTIPYLKKIVLLSHNVLGDGFWSQSEKTHRERKTAFNNIGELRRACEVGLYWRRHGAVLSEFTLGHLT